MEDPNPNVNGKGIRELRDAGIQVEAGLLEAEARELNRFFIKHVTTGLPYVTLKLAMTLDGKSALLSGKSKWITSEASRSVVHAMRAEHDAVLIGARTALLDDPELTVRLASGRQPRRIVLDARLDLPSRLKLFTDAHRAQTILITTPAAPESKRNLFSAQGIEIMVIEGSGERIDLVQMLRQFGQRNIVSILVEAGPTLAASIIEEGLFDELVLFYGPMIFGADARPSVGPLELTAITNARRLSLKSMERLEGLDDVVIRLTQVKRP
jgi:diaminohydroxyphosphoribosylaminopyrimidine deaminase/5-amino-6-(5-phosphoribosylamino)uracil reductase